LRHKKCRHFALNGEHEMAKWKEHSLEFKRRAVAKMLRCKDVSALAEKLGINRSLLYQWRYQLEGRPGKKRANLSGMRPTGREKQLQQENQLLKEALGEKVLEADFFAAALRRIEEQRRKSTVSGETISTPKSGRGASRRKAD
jgi:transposase-like protein